jgi:hypothetical protein
MPSVILLREDEAVLRVVRHAMANFDSRYAMYLAVYNGDAWDALAAALLARVVSC